MGGRENGVRKRGEREKRQKNRRAGRRAERKKMGMERRGARNTSCIPGRTRRLKTYQALLSKTSQSISESK